LVFIGRNALKAFFVSIPHSGEMIPDEAAWLKNRDEVLLMYDVDRYVNLLYAPVLQKLKIKSVIADVHRYAIDLNRLSEDVDASSVEGNKNPAGNFARGLHWVITTAGEKLMPAPISQELHAELVKRYFDPFHMAIQKTYESFAPASKVYHLDLHSMPSLGTSEHRDPG
jgi:N-formylglutamate deformylase